MPKILVNAITWKGEKIPMGFATDEKDLANMKEFANSLGLNTVVEYEDIYDPTEEDLAPAKQMMKRFILSEKFNEVLERYHSGELNDEGVVNLLRPIVDTDEELEALVAEVHRADENLTEAERMFGFGGGVDAGFVGNRENKEDEDEENAGFKYYGLN